MKSENIILLIISLIMCFPSFSKDTNFMKNSSKIKLIGGEFIDSYGNSFFPWGFNYTNSEGVDLIEDNWDDKVIWEIITDDFQEMKNMGANVVRIHLQYHRFMLNPLTPNIKALNKLKDLVELAESKGLYLLITGLAAYRKSDQPDWYAQLNDSSRWEAHKVFWENIAKHVGDNSAVFAYDLINEPVVGVGCKVKDDCSWLPGKDFGGYHFIQNISRNPENNFQKTLKKWIAELTQSIRSVDSQTLITIGFLNLGDITQFGEDLDFISPHIYPQSEEINKSIKYIEDNQSSVPLVITETFNLNCSISELNYFFDNIEGNYNGMFGHYLKKPSSLIDSSMVDQTIKKFYDFFITNNPN